MYTLVPKQKDMQCRADWLGGHVLRYSLPHSCAMLRSATVRLPIKLLPSPANSKQQQQPRHSIVTLSPPSFLHLLA